jgi:hypothetical protein
MQNRNGLCHPLRQNKVGKWLDRHFFLMAVLALASTLLCGCGVIDFIEKEPPPKDAEIMSGYYRVGIKVSNSADVIDEMYLPEYELLSQSKKVIACAGQKKKGYKSWYKMAGFEENQSTVQRKYLLIEDEKPKTLIADKKTRAIIECSMALDKELLKEPFSSENAKLIAILKKVHEKSLEDVSEVSADNNVIIVGGGMVNQAFEAAITKLESSPAEAAKLNSAKGVSFSHLSLDEGVIQMGVEYDIVTVKIKLGSLVKRFKLDFEKEPEESELDIW